MAEGCTDCRRRSRRRAARSYEPEDIARAAERMVAALGRRAAGDPGALPMLAGIALEVDTALHAAVTTAIARGWWSYADVGRALGITRQAARQRFGTGPT